MSFPDFKKYLRLHHGKTGDFFERIILSKMKAQTQMSLLATKKKLNPNRRVQCFEVFGYDFIIDSDFNTWLIEANTNPCLEESSELLKMLLPRMINDALKLSIDLIFKPGSENLDGSPFPSTQPYPVTGYPDSQNLW